MTPRFILEDRVHEWPRGSPPGRPDGRRRLELRHGRGVWSMTSPPARNSSIGSMGEAEQIIRSRLIGGLDGTGATRRSP